MKKPSEILSYADFVLEMQNPEFQARMHFAMKILVDAAEKDSSVLVGDDERIALFWKQYQDGPNTKKPEVKFK
jgi:hypothetical protein